MEAGTAVRSDRGLIGRSTRDPHCSPDAKSRERERQERQQDRGNRRTEDQHGEQRAEGEKGEHNERSGNAERDPQERKREPEQQRKWGSLYLRAAASRSSGERSWSAGPCGAVGAR